MSFEIRDFQLPAIFIAVIIGYQLAGYFFYQYYKFKDEKMDLNKFFLANGLFFVLAMTGILFRNINKFYIENPIIREMYFKITNCFLVLSILLFLYFISSRDFHEIINPNLMKLCCAISIIPLVSIFFFKKGSYVSNLIMILVFISALGMLIFHIKMIKFSERKVRKRLILIMIGELLIVGAMFFGGEYSRSVLLQQAEPFFLIIATPLSSIALCIVFLGVFRFPIILEFQWKENLIGLFIIDMLHLKIIYSYNFTGASDKVEQHSITDSDHFFTKGISGIERIMSIIASTKDEKIYKIKQGDLLIFLRHGEDPLSFITYALFVKKEMNSFKYFLKNINYKFNENYKNILLNLDAITGSEEKIFSSFDKTVKKLI